MKKYVTIFIMLILVISITGCNKDDKSLALSDNVASDVVVANTPEPTSKPIPEPTPTPDINIDLFKEQYHFTETVTDDEQGITLNFDADVVPISIKNIPVAIIKPHKITEEEADSITNAFFDDARYVDGGVYTKDQIAYSIEMVKKEAQDLNSALADITGATTMEELAKEGEKRIAELERKMAKAPDEKPSTSNPKITSSNDFFLTVDTGRSYSGNIMYRNKYNVQILRCLNLRFYETMQRYLFEPTSRKIDLNDMDEAFLKAKDISEDFMEKANIPNLKLGSAYRSSAQNGRLNEHIIDDTKYYVFCYQRIIGDGVVDYSFNQFSQNEEDGTFPQEVFEVWVDNNELQQFYWYCPDEVTEIIQENAKIEIDDTQAIELIIKQAIQDYGGRKREMKIDIERIELVLTKTKDDNSGEYMIVPAWKCFGEIAEKRSDGNYRYLLGKGQLSKNVVTINALDGTPIDVGVYYLDE